MESSALKSNFLIFITGGHCQFWSVNPYKLCDFRCTYCITGAQGRSAPTFGSKQESLSILEAALAQIPSHLPIVVGGISDAYAHAEQEFEITRGILELLIAKKRKFGVVTKSTLVERDMDLLAGYNDAKVEFSFSTLEDDVAAEFEIDAPAPSARLELLKKFWANGIAVKVSLRPWIPQISNIQTLLENIPPEIPIGLERLKIVRVSQTFTLAGRSFTQAEIDKQYLLEREKYRDCMQLKWSLDERFSHDGSRPEHPLAIILRENESTYSRNWRLSENKINQKLVGTVY